MTTSAGAMRETAIFGDSSDERIDRAENYPRDVISGASPIRQPMSGTNSCRQSPASSDLPYRDFVGCLDHGPETDILFSESADDAESMPEVETYLRLPPTSPCGHDVYRFDNLPATDAAGGNEATEIDSRQAELTEHLEVNAEQPEVDSTTTTTTTTMSLGCRSSSVGAISHVGVDCGVLPSPPAHRHASVLYRRRRLHPPETEVRRRVTSPLDRNAVAASLSAIEARRTHARALANWDKLRELYRQRQLRLLDDDARRSRSSDRQVTRRMHRASSSRDRRRRRCISTDASTARRRFAVISRSRTFDDGNAANILSFHPVSDRHSRLSDPGATARTPIPIHDSGSMGNVDLAAATASGAALPYDYEPLSFDDVGSGGPFSYTDDPFDYDDNADHDGGKVTVPITICLIIIAGYIFAGSVLFTLWEDWDYLTGSYFCFITLSTIGFGDIVPGTDMDEWASSEKLVLCALWLAFGLSLLAMCFNLMQEEVKEKCKWIGLKLGLLRDDEPQ